MLKPLFFICIYGFCIYEWDSNPEIEECRLEYL